MTAAAVGCREVVDVRPSRRVVDMRLTRDAEKEILPIIISCRVMEVDDGTEVGLPPLDVDGGGQARPACSCMLDFGIFWYGGYFWIQKVFVSLLEGALTLILDPKGFRIFGSKRFSYLLKLAGVCGRAKWELDGRVHS